MDMVSEMNNPFPSVNPWLEEFWRDIHAHLLTYACDHLNGQLLPAPTLHGIGIDRFLSTGS